MRLAVIIPCYNHAQYVGDAIESVLTQSRPADRVIVIDDGSKDDSVNVLKAFESRGVEVAVQENAGAHETLNRLVERAANDCELVAILNSDDTYLPRRFEQCLPAFEQRENLAVLSTDFHLIDDHGGELDSQSARAKWFRAAWSLRGRDFAEWMGVCNFPATTSNVIARTDYLLANPFRPYRFNHDYYLLAKAVIEDRFALVDEPLLNYRVHANNTITTAPAPLVREMLRMHLDLAAALAPELQGNKDLRDRYASFRRAGWKSISSFDAGEAEVVFADLAARAGSEILATLADTMDDAETFPNRHLVNNHDGQSPVTEAGGLCEKLDILRGELDSLKGSLAAARELARLRNRVSLSRKFALGRLLGGYRELVSDRGKTPTEKLDNFKAAAQRAGFDLS